MATASLPKFDRDTAVTCRRDGEYDVHIDGAWWIVRGPNGGYVAAMLANAIADTVGDGQRPLRSLTVHFLRPPQEGPATVQTRVVRSGRTVSTVTAELHQGGRIQALATAAHAVPRDTGGFEHAVMPEVAPPGRIERRNPADAAPLQELYDQRIAIGPSTREAPRQREAVSGGWIRLAEPRGWDVPLVVAVADAWMPPVFTAREMPETSAGVPTIDFSVHVLAPDLIAELARDDFVFVRFTTQTVRRGYLEEDGEIFSPAGRILAKARQSAVVL